MKEQLPFLLQKLNKRVNISFVVLILLLTYALLVRVAFWYDGTIPFQFDHGKDMIAVLYMLKTYTPALIGPWTSIPGLFFGPGWYYLLAPSVILGGYSPLAPVAMMTLLVLLQIYIAYLYFGKEEAIIMAAAPFWLSISTSAWNPFPMTVVTQAVILCLMYAKKQKILSPKLAVILGISASAGFHFSAAFAIFYPVVALVLLITWKVQLSWKSIIAGLFGFILPFLPQLMFEVRHDFVQTQAVISYFQEGESHAISTEKITDVLYTFYGEARSGFLGQYNGLPKTAVDTYNFAVLGLLVIAGIAAYRKKDPQVRQRTTLLLTFVGISLTGFFFLHFNVWYLYPLIPVVVLWVGSVLRTLPRWIAMSILLLLLFNPIFSLRYMQQENRAELRDNYAFLPVKQEALSLIREKAAGRPFASYHFLPDVYDFPYQYLYFMQAEQGQPLPVEFSYRPNTDAYITQKPALLELYDQQQGDPEVIFFIIEKGAEENAGNAVFESWWGDQQYGEVVEEISISPQLTLRVATPATAEAELTITE